jgi:hypothetical protein
MCASLFVSHKRRWAGAEIAKEKKKALNSDKSSSLALLFDEYKWMQRAE